MGKSDCARRAGARAANVEELEQRLLFAGGDLDTAFGFGKGYIVARFGQGQNDFLDLARQGDGKLIAGGSSQATPGARRDAYIANFTAAGKFNPNFGINGSAKINYGPTVDDVMTAVTIQPDNKILGLGITGNGTTQDVWIARFKANGTTDKTFNNGAGSRKIDWGGFDYASRIIYDTSLNKILVVGTSANPATGGGLVAARYNLDGSNDTTFGTAGLARTMPSGAFKVDAGTDIFRQSDGKYIVSGGRLSFNGGGFTGSQAYLWRINAKGKTDTTFGTGGWNITPFGRSFEFYNRVSEGPNNTLYAAGTSANGFYEFGTKLPFSLNAPAATLSSWSFGRYKLNGALDATFNTTGKRLVSFGTGEKAGLSYATVQSDGAIVAGGGTTVSGQNAKMATARILASGLLDPAWGNNGLRTLALAGLSVGFFGFRMFANGLIFGVGHAKSSGSVGSMLMTRLRNTGAFSPFALSASEARDRAAAAAPRTPFALSAPWVKDAEEASLLA